MIRPLSLFGLLALAATALPAPAIARPAPAVTATITAHGLRLSLSIPRRRYPQDALVPVTVTLRNISHRAINLSGYNLPRPLVFDDAGHLVYDPREPLGAPSFLPITEGPDRRVLALDAGQQLRTNLFIVLLGTNLRAFARLANGQSLTTRSLRLTLTAADSPAITISTTPALSVTIERRRSLPGSPFFIEETSCTAHGSQASTSRGWLRAARLTLTPLFPRACQGGRRWQAIAGWIGHSVARIAYPPIG